MATALVKSKLKAAREAITAKDWPKAEKSARLVVVATSEKLRLEVVLTLRTAFCHATATLLHLTPQTTMHASSLPLPAST